MEETITLIDGRIVSKEAYIIAKTKDLVEFGYTNLTNSEISEQLEKVLNSEKLTIIGEFIKSDIKL